MNRLQLVIDNRNNLYHDSDVPVPPEKIRELALDIRDNMGLNHMHVMTFEKRVLGIDFIIGRILIFTKQ